MLNNTRPHTPTFHFGDPENNSQPFTFADGWVHITDTNPTSPRSSDSSSRQTPPDGEPGLRTPPATSVSPHYRFGDAADYAFTFADGWVETSSSPFGVDELRDALPTSGSCSSSSGAPISRPNLLLSAQINGGVADNEDPANRSEDNSSAVREFGQGRSVEFSLRLLHNATPLPSREPSPQPTASGARADSGSGRLTSLAAPRLLGIPSPEASIQTLESSTVVPVRPRPRNRTLDVSFISDLEEREIAASYDVRNETAPAHRFFTVEFQSTLQAGLGIARDMLTELEGLDGLVQSDSNLQKFLEDANALCAFQGSDTKTIAVLGDSGEGRLDNIASAALDSN